MSLQQMDFLRHLQSLFAALTYFQMLSVALRYLKTKDEADSSGVVGAVAIGGFGVEGSGIGSEWLFPPPPPQALITRVLNIKAENLIFDIVVELLYFY